MDGLNTPEQKLIPLNTGNDTLSEKEFIGHMSPEERENYAKILELARQEGEDNKRFWNLLVLTIPKIGYTPSQTDRQMCWTWHVENVKKDMF